MGGTPSSFSDKKCEVTAATTTSNSQRLLDEDNDNMINAEERRACNDLKVLKKRDCGENQEDQNNCITNSDKDKCQRCWVYHHKDELIDSYKKIINIPNENDERATNYLRELFKNELE